MNQTEFRELLSTLERGSTLPAGSPRFCLWYGKMADLRAMAPAGLVEELDLHAIAETWPDAPRTPDETRDLLQAGVVAHLAETAPSGDAAQVVIVTGNSALQRYQLSLDAFAEASGPRRLIVFVVRRRDEGTGKEDGKPMFLSLMPDPTLAYLKAALGAEALISDG